MIANLETVVLKKETVNGTFVTPDFPLKITSCTFNEIQKYQNLEQIEGSIMGTKEIIDTSKEFTGNITFIADEENLGYILTDLVGLPQTTGTNTYTHNFNIENKIDKPTLSLEVSKGDFVQRFSGVVIDKFDIKNNDGILEVSCDVIAKNGFSKANLISISNGSLTISGNQFIKIGDSLKLNSLGVNIPTDITVATVNTTGSTTTITFLETIVPTDYTNGYLSINKKTYTYTNKNKFRFYENGAVQFNGINKNVVDFTISVMNNHKVENGVGYKSPMLLLQGMRSANLNMTMYLESAGEEIYALLNGKEVQIGIGFTTSNDCAITFIGTGKYNGGNIDLTSGSFLTIPLILEYTSLQMNLLNTKSSY